MKFEYWLINRMEELDIILVDYSGNPICFTRKFCEYSNNHDLKNPNIIKKLIVDYLGEKLTPKDDINGFEKLVQMLLEIILDSPYTLDEFRKRMIKAY